MTILSLIYLSIFSFYFFFFYLAFQDPYVIIYGGTTDPKANSTSTAGSNSVWMWNSVNGSWYDSTTLSTNNNKPQIYIKAVSLPSPGQTLILASNTTGGGSLLQKIDSNFWSWNNPTSLSKYIYIYINII